MKNLRKEKGITLIALIITIIVMLILVAVTINVALNGGIFTRAKEAKEKTQIEADRESLLMSAMACIGEDGKVDFSELNKEAKKLGFEGKDGTYSKQGYIYIVNKNTGEIKLAGTSTSEDEDSGKFKTYAIKKFNEIDSSSFEEEDIDGGYFILLENKDIEKLSIIIYQTKPYIVYMPDAEGETAYICTWEHKQSKWYYSVIGSDDMTEVDEAPILTNVRILNYEEALEIMGDPSEDDDEEKNKILTSTQALQILTEIN